MAGAGCKHIVVATNTGSKSQGQLQLHWQLWGPCLSACTTMAAGSHIGAWQWRPVTGVELDRCTIGWASCRWVQASCQGQKTRPDLSPQATAGALCHYALLWLHCLPWSGTWQWRPVMVSGWWCAITLLEGLAPSKSMVVGVSCISVDWHLHSCSQRPGLAVNVVPGL